MKSILKNVKQESVLETPNHYSHNNSSVAETVSSRETVAVGCNTKKRGNLGLCTQTDLHLLDQRLPDALLLLTTFSDVTKEEYFFLGNIY